jgi:hypothetical protein
LPLYKKHSPHIAAVKIHFYILSLLERNIEAIDEINEYSKIMNLRILMIMKLLNLFGYFFMKSEDFEKSIDVLNMAISKKKTLVQRIKI